MEAERPWAGPGSEEAPGLARSDESRTKCLSALTARWRLTAGQFVIVYTKQPQQ